MYRLTVFIICLLPLVGYALPPHSPVPGGIAVIDLKSTSSTAPKVSYNNKRVMVLRDEKGWHAVVGIPLAAQAGQHSITVKEHNPPPATISFSVRDKQYKTQHITVKNKRHVSPNKQDLDRIWREKKFIHKALRNWRETDKIDTRLLKPVEGPYSSPFGLRRFFNKQPRKPHSGIDIAATEGTPIVAPADGIVTETGDYFFNGNTVFIDHGQGLVTMYCHMSRVDVKAGDVVKRGQTFGTVGKTGRVTGAHLHWAVSLNDARIDPLLLMQPESAQSPSSGSSPGLRPK